VASGIAPEVEVGVASATPTASLLRFDQLLGLLGSASGTSSQWSSGVAVATAAELHLPRVPAALAEHALHLYSYSQTSVKSIHTHIRSDSAVFQHKKRCIENLHNTEHLIILTNSFSDKEESGNKGITQLNN
jgi:hypothetical protein